MPHYFFNIRNDYVTEDDEGLEFADDSEARAYAFTAARSLAAEAVGLGHLDLRHRIDVEDEQRQSVCTVTFADAIEVKR